MHLQRIFYAVSIICRFAFATKIHVSFDGQDSSSAITSPTLFSDIHRVKIYAGDVAEVIHHLSIDAKSLTIGLHDVIIDGFPSSLVDHSLQIVSTNDVDVFDHKIVIISYPVTEFPYYQNQIQEITTSINKIKTEIEELELEKSRVNEQLQFLQRYMNARIASTSESPTTTTSSLSETDYLQLIKFHDTESSKVTNKLSLLSKQRTEKLQQITTLEKQLHWFQSHTNYNELSNNDMRFKGPVGGMIDEKQIQLRINVKNESLHTTTSTKKPYQLEFFFRYLLQPAHWQPVYWMNIQDDNSSMAHSISKTLLQITQLAEVHQNTGMDWENVDLYLTTSQPQFIPSSLSYPARKVVSFQPQALPFRNDMMMKRSHHKRERAYAGQAMEHEMHFAAEGGSDMVMDVAASSSAPVVSTNVGGMDVSYTYHVESPVNITSRMNPRRLYTATSHQNYHHLMTIKSLSLPIDLFTFISPSIDTHAYRVAYGKFPAEEIPLIPSQTDNTRIEISDEYIGTTIFTGMQPNQYFHQNLGLDSLLEVSYSTSIPKNSHLEEDKSTWFVKDSVKYKILTEEKSIFIKNGHRQSTNIENNQKKKSEDVMLVVVVDTIPASNEENDIKITLLSPDKSELRILTENSSEGVDTNEQFFNRILQKEYASKPGSSTTLKSGSDVLRVTAYHCSASGNLYWMIWAKPTFNNIQLSLKYKITRPFDREVYIY